MVSEGQFVGLDWNRIARLHSQVLVSTCENSLTASRCHIKADQDQDNNIINNKNDKNNYSNNNVTTVFF